MADNLQPSLSYHINQCLPIFRSTKPHATGLGVLMPYTMRPLRTKNTCYSDPWLYSAFIFKIPGSEAPFLL